jgi:hypothetical protein
MVEINLEIEDEVKVFTLPESWDEITIDDFIKLFNIDRTGLSDVELAVKTIALLTNMDEEIIMTMDFKDFEKVANVLLFTTKDVEPTNSDFILIEDEKYYIKNDFSKLTMGEVISIETLLQSADGNLFKVMDKLLCVFLRKKNEKGELETFKGHFMDRAEMFKKAPISRVYNVFSFFSTGGSILGNNTKDSSVVPPKKKIKKKIDLKK